MATAKTTKQINANQGTMRDVGWAVDRLLKCREKAKLSGRKIQVTGALALNIYNTAVGNEQRTVKKLYVKVHSFALLGKLSEDTVQQADPHPDAAPDLEPHMDAVGG